MTASQIQEARLRLRNMYFWLINEAGSNNFEEKARAVENYYKLLQRAERRIYR